MDFLSIIICSRFSSECFNWKQRGLFLKIFLVRDAHRIKQWSKADLDVAIPLSVCPQHVWRKVSGYMTDCYKDNSVAVPVTSQQSTMFLLLSVVIFSATEGAFLIKILGKKSILIRLKLQHDCNLGMFFLISWVFW